jgi:hypothetical protein
MQLPGPVRAVVGLLANAAEEAKHLPDRAIELPMLAVSTALQASLRAQQRYARLAARGEEVLSRRTPTDDPPPWATFDDPVTTAGGDDADAGPGRVASDLLDELLGPDGDGPTPLRAVAPEATAPATTGTADEAPVQKGPVQKAPARKAPARKAPAKKAAVKDTAVKDAAVKATGTAARKAPAKRLADGAGPGKSVSKPRHTAPSRFDAVSDD